MQGKETKSGNAEFQDEQKRHSLQIQFHKGKRSYPSLLGFGYTGTQPATANLFCTNSPCADTPDATGQFQCGAWHTEAPLSVQNKRVHMDSQLLPRTPKRELFHSTFPMAFLLETLTKAECNENNLLAPFLTPLILNDRFFSPVDEVNKLDHRHIDY